MESKSGFSQHLNIIPALELGSDNKKLWVGVQISECRRSVCEHSNRLLL